MADRGRDILARVSAKSGPRLESADKVAAHYAAEEPKVTKAAGKTAKPAAGLGGKVVAAGIAALSGYSALSRDAKADGPAPAKSRPAKTPAQVESDARIGGGVIAGVGVAGIAAGIGVAHEGQTPRGRRIAKIAGGAGVGAGVLLTAVGAALAYTGGKRSTEPGKDRTDPYTDKLGRNYAQGRKITRQD